MNSFYAEKFKKPYDEITKKVEDFRAKRITSYLNLVDEIVTQKFEDFKERLLEKREELEDYITMLPLNSEFKAKLVQVIGKSNRDEIKSILDENLHPGSIDVNIMTKLDKDNFIKGEQLSIEHNDAHAALRGFALSNIQSSIIFSAGMNPRLFSYMETFDGFYPNEAGEIKKKIVLKVSDYRSALIQGSFLAKKGLWVSEYRLESGLNCGGHAFATDGLLMGPILQVFKDKREDLYNATFGLLKNALTTKEKTLPTADLSLIVTAQGGVGTAEEQQFLVDNYDLASIGWGSPFLLVPEATSVDVKTRNLLAAAQEKDFYLSNISPLGIPFNTVRGTSNELLKNSRIEQEKAGSSCPKKFLALSKEYDKEGTCTASKKVQDLKLGELETRRSELTEKQFAKETTKITEKACLCVGLANASYMENGIPIKGQAQGVAICPGPNMAYFTKEVSLKEMVHHIYGVNSIIVHRNRPNLFIKELEQYISYLKEQIEDLEEASSKKWEKFRNNLYIGIAYYKDIFSGGKFFNADKERNLSRLNEIESELK